jgi:hypothetical protein
VSGSQGLPLQQLCNRGGGSFLGWKSDEKTELAEKNAVMVRCILLDIQERASPLMQCRIELRRSAKPKLLLAAPSYAFSINHGVGMTFMQERVSKDHSTSSRQLPLGEVGMRMPHELQCYQQFC